MAMGHMPSHLRLWLVTALGLAADLWTKEWAFGSLTSSESRVVIKNLCNLQLSLNPGALFGIGAGMAPIFVTASVLALLFVLYLFANSGSRRWSMHLALGLVLGGALGNLWDRTTQEAYVARFADGRRVVGTLHGEPSESGVMLGDFPDGQNPRFFNGRLDSDASGVQPVVRDFIRIEAKINGYHLWPWVFNIADALLVFGVGILLINFWFDRRHHLAQARAAPGEGETAVDSV